MCRAVSEVGSRYGLECLAPQSSAVAGTQAVTQAVNMSACMCLCARVCVECECVFVDVGVVPDKQ